MSLAHLGWFGRHGVTVAAGRFRAAEVSPELADGSDTGTQAWLGLLATGVPVGGDLDRLAEQGTGALVDTVGELSPLLPQSDGQNDKKAHDRSSEDKPADQPEGQ